MEFKPFPKIPRLSRDIIITEKIDGTNAQIVTYPEVVLGAEGGFDGKYVIASKDGNLMFAGSRSKFIRPGDDNYGFAGWVQKNADELFKLGQGHHYGEWWGQGIQRRYGLEEKRFSLFNVSQWFDAYTAMREGHDNDFPKCCHVVPLLFRGGFDGIPVSEWIERLSNEGSIAAPGFKDPEGIVVFHTASGTMFKKTCKSDDKPKGSTE